MSEPEKLHQDKMQFQPWLYREATETERSARCSQLINGYGQCSVGVEQEFGYSSPVCASAATSLRIASIFSAAPSTGSDRTGRNNNSSSI